MSAESFLDSNIILYNYMNTEVAKKNLSERLIIAAALESGCTTLYSEDMQNGLKIDFLTIVNPFVSEQKG